MNQPVILIPAKSKERIDAHARQAFYPLVVRSVGVYPARSDYMKNHKPGNKQESFIRKVIFNSCVNQKRCYQYCDRMLQIHFIRVNRVNAR